MKSDKPKADKPPHGTGRDPNQGEGDKASARQYNRHARAFVEEGKVDEAARDAARFVENDPEAARRAEKAGQRRPGRSRVSVDELVARSRTVVERVRPVVGRVVDRVVEGARRRFGRTPRR